MNRRAVLTELGSAALLASPLVAYGVRQPDPEPEHCPSFQSDPSATVCRGDDAPVTIRVEKSVGPETRVDSVRFVVRNGTSEPWLVGPNSWDLHEWTAAGWRHVAPDNVWPTAVRLQPSARYSWVIGPNGTGTEGETVIDEVALERGQWAFSTVARPEAADAERGFELVATYRVP
ncbi:hypothetical protein [Haloarchaeobius sp. TZWSO28]|uniref:hypothetical protein n=1 Tax=Haloarchaeobius sp. TZWSO28 TaxID=3446119 RepID=UPI003EBC5E1E